MNRYIARLDGRIGIANQRFYHGRRIVNYSDTAAYVGRGNCDSLWGGIDSLVVGCSGPLTTGHSGCCVVEVVIEAAWWEILTQGENVK